MSDYSNLDHAKHNEDVCIHLVENTKFGDWIITTAFYSAMHYMRDKLFPLKVIKTGVEIIAKDFDHYCLIMDKVGRKHNVLRKLVEENTPIDIAAAYNQMLDASWTARYSRYKFSEKVAKLAKKRLMAVKNYVLKVEETKAI
jgi:hypothetical protein